MVLRHHIYYRERVRRHKSILLPHPPAPSPKIWRGGVLLNLVPIPVMLRSWGGDLMRHSYLPQSVQRAWSFFVG